MDSALKFAPPPLRSCDHRPVFLCLAYLGPQEVARLARTHHCCAYLSRLCHSTSGLRVAESRLWMGITNTCPFCILACTRTVSVYTFHRGRHRELARHFGTFALLP